MAKEGEQQQQQQQEWRVEEISQSLQTQAEISKHAVLGAGWRFEVGAYESFLELYPRARHAELRTRSVLIGLSQVQVQALGSEDGLLLSCLDGDEQALVWLKPNGRLTLSVSPPRSLDEVLESQGNRGGVSQEDEQQQPQEKAKKTVILSGRIKSKMQAGKPDRNGKPTAWGRIAVHEEGRSDARLYLASFHRHTTNIALGLSPDDPITVEGYPHPAREEGKLDTFSVINLHHYTGKPQRKP